MSHSHNDIQPAFPAPEPDGSMAGPWSHTVRRENGELRVGGVKVSQLVAAYGTPLYVIDEEDFRTRARRWVVAMNTSFADLAGARVFYACKALMSVGIARWVLEDGLALDTCSEGEFVTALAAGAKGHDIGLHGNNKSEREIMMALEHNISHMVVDSMAELRLVERIAENLGKRANIVLRVTAGVHAGGHEFISTAHEDQKFGLSIQAGQAWEAAQATVASPHLELVGLHSHIGSQILSVDAFSVAAQAVLDLRACIHNELACTVPELDLGGGYGIRYTGADATPPEPEAYAELLATVVRAHGEKTGIAHPLVSIEPGRSIVGPAGLTLYTVGTTKNVQLDDTHSRRYVSVDGGMSDNIRPALYDAQYTVAVANREARGEGTLSRVVGKHCESGDIVVHNVELPADVTAGDILATPATGAYGRVMASNYNMLSRPGVVAVHDGSSRVLIRRETVADQLALDADYQA
ncbi:diaminopimelate decarboxylase [Actinotignum urinale]|uniref:Diaminopimelate decarboxylase n=1 Tax=Actinotignum urinale TaxID=190146 RepID=A0ABU5G6U2_9ACTO|nr:diaminopimelate decarboxylase [Actinotignum urinale]MDY5129427.1 diaminopimelate decarboxylase [Actinotignum urinale]MDY5132902.1 diaminopimelate decarboxylase [Actinotignum urinale]